jgi:hypothetical protein
MTVWQSWVVESGAAKGTQPRCRRKQQNQYGYDLNPYADTRTAFRISSGDISARLTPAAPLANRVRAPADSARDSHLALSACTCVNPLHRRLNPCC